MSTLLLTLSGPLQAWGSRSRFTTRSTESAPTKSGVVGLLAAALGLPRTANLERFNRLKFGVRIDQVGRVERDFQTARTLDGTRSMPLSSRYYLADAVFLAGLEHEDRAILDTLAQAVAHPVFPLYLGRRAFPPAGPIPTQIVDTSLEQALRSAEWRATRRYQDHEGASVSTLTYLIDAATTETATDTLRDEPLSFNPERREYGWRDIREETVALAPSSVSNDPTSLVAEGRGAQRYHEPLDALPKEV